MWSFGREVYPDPALHTTGVVPRAKVLLDAGRQLTSTAPSQMSEAVAVNATTVPPGAAHSTTMLVGQAITGGSTSVTVTVKLQFWLLLAESEQRQFTGVIPLLKVEFEGGVQLTVTGPSQASAAVTL